MVDEALARHLACPQPGQMRCILLAVDHADTVVKAKRHQGSKRDFRCVRAPCKHRFAKHGPTDRHAVQPPDQLPVDPGFDTVRVTGTMQCAVGTHHFRHDPGTGLTAASSPCAGGNHRIEIVVDAHLTGRVRSELKHGLAK